MSLKWKDESKFCFPCVGESMDRDCLQAVEQTRDNIVMFLSDGIPFKALFLTQENVAQFPHVVPTC